MKKEFKTFVKRGPMWEEFERSKNSGAPIIRDLIQDDSPIFRNGWVMVMLLSPKVISYTGKNMMSLTVLLMYMVG